MKAVSSMYVYNIQICLYLHIYFLYSYKIMSLYIYIYIYLHLKLVTPTAGSLGPDAPGAAEAAGASPLLMTGGK